MARNDNPNYSDSIINLDPGEGYGSGEVDATDTPKVTELNLD